MLQHLSVIHIYTLCTHNLTKFLLCWRVLFWPSFIGCFPPAPPSFLCTLFFSFNFYLLWFPLHVLFLLLQLVLLLPSFISIFHCFFFVTYSSFLLFFLISFLSPFFFPRVSHSLAFIYDHTENVELLGSMCFLFTIFMFSWNPEFASIQTK